MISLDIFSSRKLILSYGKLRFLYKGLGLRRNGQINHGWERIHVGRQDVLSQYVGDHLNFVLRAAGLYDLDLITSALVSGFGVGIGRIDQNFAVRIFLQAHLAVVNKLLAEHSCHLPLGLPIEPVHERLLSKDVRFKHARCGLLFNGPYVRFGLQSSGFSVKLMGCIPAFILIQN